MLLENKALTITLGWLHGSARGPLGIAGLLLIVFLIWRGR